MLILQNLTYTYPGKDLLFNELNLTIGQYSKVGLIGNNGTGKSTLLKIIAGSLAPSAGLIKTGSTPYYIPQLFGQFNELTIAQALNIEEKLTALQQILHGNVTEENMTLLNDDWTIEERCNNALAHWGLQNINLEQKTGTLSGGQKTKAFLAGIYIHQPKIVLLDEPSNHLDTAGRQLLYDFIQHYSGILIVVSHDKKLLNLLDSMYELSRSGITIYGGNYDFYTKQKTIEKNALTEEIRGKEKALRKAKEIERESAEKQQKLDAKGKRNRESAGLATILLNTYRNNAERSTARMKEIHAEKTGTLLQELNESRAALPGIEKMRLAFDNATLHKGKLLIDAKNINYTYSLHLLWKEHLNFQLTSGERIVLKGLNGSGKTTLIKLILGELEPASGSIYRTINNAVYIDQDYSIINNRLNVYEQAQQFNHTALQEHEIKIRLNRFLFTKEYWDKSCNTLSGGEKMRLILCCLTIYNQAPDIIILDEPTNNLDIQNIEILTTAINDYKGTLITVSHDEYFLKQVNVQRTIELS